MDQTFQTFEASRQQTVSIVPIDKKGVPGNAAAFKNIQDEYEYDAPPFAIQSVLFPERAKQRCFFGVLLSNRYLKFCS